MSRNHHVITRSARFICSILLATMILPAPTASAEDLPAIWGLPPADAQLVFVIPDMSRFARKMQLLNTELALDIPGMNDVMDEFRRTTDMSKGLNEQGAFIIVVTDLDGMSDTETPPSLLLAPITSYEDFVGNFGGNPRARSAELAMPWGQTAFARQEGDYAVISARQDLVGAYKAGGNATRFSMTNDPYNAAAIEAADIAVMFNADAARPITENFSTIVGDAVGASIAAMYPRAETFIERVTASTADLVQQTLGGVLDNAEIVGFTVDIQTEGVSITMLSQFRSGAKLSPVFTSKRNVDAGLSRFPDDAYFFAATVDAEAMDLAKFSTTIADSLKKQNVPWFGAKLAGMADTFAQTKRLSKVYFAPPQISLNTTLAPVNIYDTTDSRTFAAAFRAYVDRVDNHTITLGQLPGPDGRVRSEAPPVDITLTTQYTPNALVIEGITVDQYQIAYNFPPQLMAALGKATGWFIMLTGREQSGYIAAVDNQVILTSTPDSELVRKVIATLRNSNGLGTGDALNETRKRLGRDPIAEGYFNVNHIVNSLNQAVNLMGRPIEPIVMHGGALPPIGMSLSADQRGGAMRLYMPMSVLRHGRNPFMHLWDQLFADEQSMAEDNTNNRRGNGDGNEFGDPNMGGAPIPGRDQGRRLPPGLR